MRPEIKSALFKPWLLMLLFTYTWPQVQAQNIETGNQPTTITTKAPTSNAKDALEKDPVTTSANLESDAAENTRTAGSNQDSAERTFAEKAVDFLILPGISVILILIIFVGIFIELKTPGVGGPGLMALVALGLFFAPHYIEGMAASWEIMTFVAGLFLVALEIFVIPGFGVAGVMGLLGMIISLSISFVKNEGLAFDTIPLKELLFPIAMVILAMVTAILLVIWAARHILTDTRAWPFVDNDTQDKEKGYTTVSQELLNLVGREGIAATQIMPSGFVELDGKKWDAKVEEGYIQKGTPVKVEKLDSIFLVVIPLAKS